MKRYIFILLILAASAVGQVPDSAKIMWVHASIGARIMNAYVEKFKIRVDSLGTANGWPIGVWDYRTNSNPADSWAGWRTARFDSSTHKSGYMVGDIYNYSSRQMWFHDLTAFWTTATAMKNGLLALDSVYDPDPNPDTLVDITDFNSIWVYPAYWHYGNNEADSFASYRAQALAWRDSADNYTDKIFVYINQVPIKKGAYVENTYTYSTVEKANAFALDKFWRDTLQDTSNHPNFLTWSWFDMLVEKSTDSTRYAYIKTIYEGTDDHPGNYACEVMQDSLIKAWMPRLATYMQDYFGSQKNLVTLTSGMLPYAAQTNDSIVFGAHTLYTGTNGITIYNVHNVYVEMDTLVFDTNRIGGHRGIYIDQSYDIEIAGGKIIQDTTPSSGAPDWIGNSPDNNCIYWANSHHVTVHDVDMIPCGWNGHAIYTGTGCTTFYNNELYGGSILSRCSTYYNRATYDGAPIKLEIKDDVDQDNGPVQMKIHDIDSLFTFAQGIVVAGWRSGTMSYPKVEIYNNNIVGDARNYYYEWLRNSPGGESGFQSHANPYGIHLTFCGVSKVYNNSIVSGSRAYGSRGLILESCKGTPSNWVDVYNNYLYCHEGPYAGGGNDGAVGNMHATRIRSVTIDVGNDGNPANDTLSISSFINFHDNTVIAIADGIPLSDTLTCDTAGAYGMKVEALMWSMQYAVDSFIRVDNNHFEARALDAGVTYCAAAAFEYSISNFNGCTFDNNRLISDGIILALGMTANNNSDVVLIGDTLEYGSNRLSSIDNTVYIYGLAEDNILRDCIYLNGADPEDYFIVPSQSGLSEYTVQRTINVQVLGNNGLPVPSCSVYVWNKFKDSTVTAQAVAAGITNLNGLFFGTVNMAYYADDIIDTSNAQFNPFRIKAKYPPNGDKLSNVYTVTESTYNDTLVLANTVGTGISEMWHENTIIDTEMTTVQIKVDYHNEVPPLLPYVVYFSNTGPPTLSGDVSGYDLLPTDPDTVLATGLSPGTFYWYQSITGDANVVCTSLVGTVHTAYDIQQNLYVIYTGWNTFRVQNDYVANVLDSMKLVWDDDRNIVDPLGVSKVTTGFTNPDTLTASGLAGDTKYFYWWIIADQKAGLDTTVIDSIITTASPEPPTASRYLPGIKR